MEAGNQEIADIDAKLEEAKRTIEKIRDIRRQRVQRIDATMTNYQEAVQEHQETEEPEASRSQ